GRLRAAPRLARPGGRWQGSGGAPEATISGLPDRGARLSLLAGAAAGHRGRQRHPPPAPWPPRGAQAGDGRRGPPHLAGAQGRVVTRPYAPDRYSRPRSRATVRSTPGGGSTGGSPSRSRAAASASSRLPKTFTSPSSSSSSDFSIATSG